MSKTVNSETGVNIHLSEHTLFELREMLSQELAVTSTEQAIATIASGMFANPNNNRNYNQVMKDAWMCWKMLNDPENL